MFHSCNKKRNKYFEYAYITWAGDIVSTKITLYRGGMVVLKRANKRQIISRHFIATFNTANVLLTYPIKTPLVSQRGTYWVPRLHQRFSPWKMTPGSCHQRGPSSLSFDPRAGHLEVPSWLQRLGGDTPVKILIRHQLTRNDEYLIYHISPSRFSHYLANRKIPLLTRSGQAPNLTLGRGQGQGGRCKGDRGKLAALTILCNLRQQVINVLPPLVIHDGRN